jgi:hypothetical protein
MTWEITLGFFAIISAFIAVMKVVVRVNRTLTSLESAVNRLNDCIERQGVKNEKIFSQLSSHELRLTRLEDAKTFIIKERS